MEGVDGFRMYELHEDRVREILLEHGRLIE
jgi:hypothetical protein